MKVYQKLIKDLASEISYNDYVTYMRVGNLCANISPDDFIKQINNYKDFLDKNGLKYEDSILNAKK